MSGSITCPQCSKMMQSNAKVCGFCSYDLVKNQPASSPKKGLIGCFAITALLILGVVILGGIRTLVDEGSPAPAVATQ